LLIVSFNLDVYLYNLTWLFCLCVLFSNTSGLLIVRLRIENWKFAAGLLPPPPALLQLWVQLRRWVRCLWPETVLMGVVLCADGSETCGDDGQSNDSRTWNKLLRPRYGQVPLTSLMMANALALSPCCAMCWLWLTICRWNFLKQAGPRHRQARDKSKAQRVNLPAIHCHQPRWCVGVRTPMWESLKCLGALHAWGRLVGALHEWVLRRREFANAANLLMHTVDGTLCLPTPRASWFFAYAMDLSACLRTFRLLAYDVDLTPSRGHWLHGSTD